jgi:hypothetical protein
METLAGNKCLQGDDVALPENALFDKKTTGNCFSKRF